MRRPGGIRLADAGRQRRVWERVVPPLFQVQISSARARAEIARYARALGLDGQSALASLPDEPLVFDAIALDETGHPLPILHSDGGFTLLLDQPPARVIEQIIRTLLRPFPAGLMTPVGFVVADGAYRGRRAGRGSRIRRTTVR